jgi:hypothetical protein
MPERKILKSVIAVAMLSLSIIARADDSASGNLFLDDKYTIWLGGFFPNVDSRIRIDPDIGSPGDGLDFEDTLGLADGKSVLFGGVRWRQSRRHIYDLEFIQLNRSGHVSGISEDLNIGDYEIRVGGRIDSVFDVAIGRFTYGYSAIATDKTVLSLKAGLHFAKFDSVLKLGGAVFQDGMPIGDPSTSVEQSAQINAPLPHFGVSYAQILTPKTALRAHALLFSIKYADYKGTLLDFGLDIHYRPWRQFGLGGGLRYFRATVEDDSDSGLRGRFLYEYIGPAVYGTWSF